MGIKLLKSTIYTIWKSIFIIILNFVVDMGKKIEKQSHIKLEHIEPTAHPSSSKSRPEHKTAKI